MTTLQVIENKISAVRKYLKILIRYRKYTKAHIEKDVDIRGAVERYLYLVVQATIDLAESFIAYKNFRKPTTMSEAFHILKEEGILASQLSEKLVDMTGFRNVVAHDYEQINYDIVLEILQSGLKDIEEFLGVIKKLL